MLTQEQLSELEALIDATSLSAVLQGLANIAGEKADHVATSYDDAMTSRVWEVANSQLEKMSAKFFNI